MEPTASPSNRRAIFWRIVLHAITLEVGYGLLLGATVYPLVLLGFYALAIVGVIPSEDFGGNLGVELLGTVIIVVLAAGFGTVIGGVVGLFIGALNGLLTGWLSVTRFLPVQDAGSYRRTVMWTSLPIVFCLTAVPLSIMSLTSGRPEDIPLSSGIVASVVFGTWRANLKICERHARQTGS